jgi:hypothetical protein
MTQVADAIRAKGGTTEPLVWPNGFSAAVEGIQAGGGGDAEAMLAGVVDGTGTEVVIPEGVTQIRRYAICYFTGRVNLVLPDSLETINDYGFNECLFTSVQFGNSLKVIKQRAFYKNELLTMDSLPETLETIGSYAFSVCKSLRNISLPASLKTLDSGAFDSCSALSNVTINANSALTIGSFALGQCINLATVTFTGKPSSINSSAFSYSNKLTTINVPWAEGAVSGAPWGATKATINYNYTGG